MIRIADIKDAERLSEIVVYGWRTAYKEILPSEFLYGELSVVKRHALFLEQLSAPHGYHVFEEEATGLVKGFVLVTDSRDEDMDSEVVHEIIAIYVEPAFKSQGIGTELIRYCETLAKLNNKKQMSLWVLEDNVNSRKFYEKQGFKPDGRNKIYEKFGINELRYSKVLL